MSSSEDEDFPVYSVYQQPTGVSGFPNYTKHFFITPNLAHSYKSYPQIYPLEGKVTDLPTNNLLG